jgi:3',5'-cyclic AMP phosphodiesterase CpdA
MRDVGFRRVALLAACSALVSACSSGCDPARAPVPPPPPPEAADGGQPDAGGAPLDAGMVDAGVEPLDAGMADAGVEPLDAGMVDAGVEPLDAGMVDAGGEPLDAGTLDAGIGAQDAGAVDAGGPVPDGGVVAQSVDLGGGVRVWPALLEAGTTARVRYSGRLAGGAQLAIHYGFNGWNELGVGQSSDDDGTGNRDYWTERWMAPVPGESAWEVNIELPVGARALHFVFHARVTGGVAWDNNLGADWQRGVGIPLVGPLLSYSATPSLAPVVAFHTGHPCAGAVDFGLTSALGSRRSEASAATAHSLTLDGLAPGATYFYRAGCEGTEQSPTYSFRTAPSGPEPFSFLVLGDAQWTGEAGEAGRWPDVAETALQNHGDAAFILSVGDMPWNDRPGLWWTFFDGARTLFATRMVMAVPGNHDTPTVNSNPDTSSFQRWFSMPTSSGSETWYAFRYGDAQFLALNSERPEDFARDGGAQYAFAQRELAAPNPPTWSFAFWHIPPYNVGDRHPGVQGTFRDLTALFEGRVDFAFSGHEHLYQRLKPLRYNAVLAPSGRYGRGPSDGVGYVVVPPAGAAPSAQLVPRTSAKAAAYRSRLAYPLPPNNSDQVPSEVGYVVVDVDGTKAILTAYGVGSPVTRVPAHVVDSVVVDAPLR